MFFSRYSQALYRSRWVILFVWLAAAVASQLLLPSLNKVVSGKGTTFLPPTATSMVASRWLKRVDPANQSPASTIVAIEDSNGLSNKDTTYFMNVLKHLHDQRTYYHISSVTAAYNTNSQVKSSFESKDKTTQIAVVGLTDGVGQPGSALAFQRLHAAFQSHPSTTRVFFTGDAEIQQDNMTISQQGVSKSALVTVILVLVILLLVFQSVVAPIVTLLSIGMSFLITSGVVAWLAKLGLPVSTFTQTFLIAILFGAGTDYSIIIMNRFREELMRGHPSRVEALTAALKAVSKTVLFSGLTVFVSFAILYFAKFGLYQSAVGVAVGMLISLLTCLIFIPAMLSILGPHLFWPKRPNVGASHPPFKFWAWSSRISTRRPWVMLGVLVIALAPVGLLFTNNRTFDPMTDIPEASSVQGFHVLASKFGQGKVMPVNIVLKTSGNLRTPEGLATIQNITETLHATSGVSEVDSATEPTGRVISSFQLTHQDVQVANSLGTVQNGLNQLHAGVSKMAASSGKSVTQVNRLEAGSEKISQGLTQLSQGLTSVSSNTSKLAVGSKQLEQGLTAVQSGTTALASGTTKVNSGAQQLANGLSKLQQGTAVTATSASQLTGAATQLRSAAEQLANALAAWSKAHPSDAVQPSWQQIVGIANGLATGQGQVLNGTKQLTQGLNQINTSTGQLAKGANALGQAARQVASGTQSLANQTPQLVKGSAGIAEGVTAIQAGTSRLSSAGRQLATGNQAVTGGIHQMGRGLQRLVNGVQVTDNSVKSINQGIGKVNTFLKQMGLAGRNQNPGFYVPASAIASNRDLKQAMNAFISADGHVTKFSVILTHNPYSTTAIDQVPSLLRTAQTALAASPIHSGSILASGATASQSDLNQVSSADFVRTMTIVLSAICLLLVVMLQSVLTPLYIILSLAGTYFVTMGLLQEVVVHILHEPGISWVSPFFVFLLLVALGVDYSIFLMARFEEEISKAENIHAAMRESMQRMGGVIYSAAFIMAGTFGSLGASGVTSLLEIAMGVVIGLFVYTTVFIAFFIPSAAAVIGEGHFWPFWKLRTDPRE